ncbi:MAG: hypothetical protein PUF61_14525 [Spirochaetales bacterium]|nr:hypothetical protein [Spirochaetales bacterium]
MDNNTEKKWTEWSVVSTGDGTFRCKRTNVADEKDTEYSEVNPPVFSKEELSDLVTFGSTGLLTVSQLTNAAYDKRYRENAFRRCAALNGAK